MIQPAFHYLAQAITARKGERKHARAGSDNLKSALNKYQLPGSNREFLPARADE